MAFADVEELATNKAFQDRVLVAVIRAATNVGSEDYVDGTDYDRYLRRANLSANVMNVPSAHRESWAWIVAAQPAITPQSSDSDIEWTVNSLWDGVAGVIEPAPEPAP